LYTCSACARFCAGQRRRAAWSRSRNEDACQKIFVKKRFVKGAIISRARETLGAQLTRGRASSGERSARHAAKNEKLRARKKRMA